MNAPFQIETTYGYSAKTGVKMGVYSKSGIGKTRLIATAPKPFVLSAEQGLLSLNRFQIPHTRITTLQQLDAAYTWFLNRGDGSQFQTICLDSISELAETILEAFKKTNKDPRKAYGNLTDEIMQRYRGFRDLQYRHVYFIAQQERTVDEDTGATFYGPAYPGQKLGQKTPYLFDETFNLFVDNAGTRWLRTRPNAQFTAKDRSGVLDEFEPADLSHIITKIMAKAA
jgi:hypothetical protein